MVDPRRCSPTFVLVGGEAYEWQGGPVEQREFQHTSVPFVGSAYEALRSAGVPRSSIITIVQLQDYFSTLARGEKGELIDITGIPPKYYTEQRERTEEKCRRLLAEGGANYDNEDVNPGTVWSVLLGETLGGSGTSPVVPADGEGPIIFGIYSHGDCHPAASSGEAAEWFAHFPYRCTRDDIYEFVATAGAKDAGRGKDRPLNYLYATQLRLIFHRIFDRSPKRPILGLLNYCLSGGNLEFMRKESVRLHFNVDRWPLFLMSSSQAAAESMVAGMWDAWFRQLQSSLQSGPAAMARTTVMGLYAESVSAYYRDNSYELLNAIKARVYAPRIFSRQFSFPGQKDDAWDPWHIDLKNALQASLPKPGGSFTHEALTELQRAYEAGECFRIIRRATPEQRQLLLRAGGVAVEGDSGEVLVWMNSSQTGCQNVDPGQFAQMNPQPYSVQLVEYSGVQESGRCKDLADILRKALGEIAHPDEVHGIESGIADCSLQNLLSQ